MSDQIPSMPSINEMTRRAGEALDEAELRRRWAREQQCDQSARDIAALTLVVNALSAEVKDNCFKKSVWEKPIRWLGGVFLTAMMAPLSVWIWEYLKRLRIGPQ